MVRVIIFLIWPFEQHTESPFIRSSKYMKSTQNPTVIGILWSNVMFQTVLIHFGGLKGFWFRKYLDKVRISRTMFISQWVSQSKKLLRNTDFKDNSEDMNIGLVRYLNAWNKPACQMFGIQLFCLVFESPLEYQIRYSGDLNSELVRYSNGPK